MNGEKRKLAQTINKQISKIQFLGKQTYMSESDLFWQDFLK